MQTVACNNSALLGQSFSSSRSLSARHNIASLDRSFYSVLGSRALSRRRASAPVWKVSLELQSGDRDDYKEASRKYRRTVFDFNRWSSHRSSKRYARHLQGLLTYVVPRIPGLSPRPGEPRSRIVRGLYGPLGSVALIAFFVCLYEEALKRGLLPHFPGLSVETGQFNQLTSFALSLLLVFRTNTSYSRFDEARKLWGGLLNRTRDLMRQGLTYFDREDHLARQQLNRWTIAFSKSLMWHLREDIDLQQEIEGVLTPEEAELMMAAQHKPNYCLQVMSEIIYTYGDTTKPAQLMRMDENLTFFADVVGACERIFKTPIPLSYTRHTSRFLVMWLGFLPFTLWKQTGWATIPLSILVAFLLLGIEEIGVQIEEPFSILALEKICGSVESNANELLDKTNETYYLIHKRAIRSGNGSSNATNMAEVAKKN